MLLWYKHNCNLPGYSSVKNIGYLPVCFWKGSGFWWYKQYGQQSQGLFYALTAASPDSVLAQHMPECPEERNQYLDYIQCRQQSATLQQTVDR